MQLISKLSIKGVRSIQFQELQATGSLNALVGKNSSGKSNVLRALNLFFNAQIDRGKGIEFGRDHHERSPSRKQKKRIAISADFKLPANFRFRKELAHINDLGPVFTITRSWELDQFRQPQEQLELRVDGKLRKNGGDLARQFLTLINYRYIPNRSVPVDLLRNESQAIANLIFSRMKGDQHATQLLKALNNASGRMLESVSGNLRHAGSPLSSPSVATANTIAEMLRISGFKALGEHGLHVQDEEWGAGHQAFFLYQVLRQIDTSYGQFFGWKQATIWGVEEPEAGLHRDLETQLAQLFREWCTDESLRLQMFTTTHSPIFTMASDTGYWVELQGGETRADATPIQKLARDAELRGVSSWIHPALYFPWNPVVLVEGELDVRALSHCSELIGFRHLRFVCVPDLEENEKSGGKDKIVAFLKRSAALIKNRQIEAPLVVLLDWDVTPDELQKAVKAYGSNGSQFVFRMDATQCATEMGPDFRGTERFYPPSIVKESHSAGECIVGMRDGSPYSISPAQLSAAKRRLLERYEQIQNVQHLGMLPRIIAQIDNSIKATFGPQLNLAKSQSAG